MPIDAQELVQTARMCLKTPFHHQGRVAGVGLDCAGLIVHIAKMHKLKYNDMMGYSREPDGWSLEAFLDKQPGLLPCTSSTELDRRAGDILLLWINRKHIPRHLAILSSPTRMIHTCAMVERVVENDVDERWEKRIVKVYRFKEVA